MDNGVDRYLHKKFKKQLTIETSRATAINNNSNNESVPTTYSTNRSESSGVCVKSSISDILVNSEIVSSTDCVKYGEAEDISYVKVSVNQESSLVTTTSSTSTNHVVEKKEGGGKHVCPYCNLACSKPSVLQKHIRAHTNERPYPCVSCGFSFKTRSNLYKHCRSRTHANRVMGNKAQEITSEIEGGDSQSKESTLEVQEPPQPQEIKAKPYKPRFHTKYDNSENAENESKQDLISLHINELIDKNNSIVNTSEPYLAKRRSSMTESVEEVFDAKDEPLNLTKNRKRCLSEVSEQITQKSLIKELLLKNLYADTNMQCPHCKMIFQTVTELELHKMRSCKGFTKSGARYSRSSSVNVASILTQNKNAFDNIPQLQNAVFPLKSPGPFLGKTRLVESDKTKSFSFEDGIQFTPNAQRFTMSPLSLSYERVKKPPVKLFGGEVKITQTSGETKSFKIDGKDRDKYNQESHVEYGGRLSENRVVKSTLGSGGTVLQSKPSYNQETLRTSPDVIRVFENTSVSPNIDIPEQQQHKYHHQEQERVKENGSLMNDTGHVTNVAYTKYTNIMDFSQNAAKMLAPNLKQLNLTIPGLPMPTKFIEATTAAAPLLAPATLAAATTAYPSEMNSSLKIDAHKRSKATPDAKLEIDKFSQKSPIILSDPPLQNGNVNPMNLLINGKVVRYVPGMPGPAAPIEQSVIQKPPRLIKPNIMITPVEPPPKPEPEKPEPIKTEIVSPESTPRKFARPNSLALKPSMTSLKQHHGLTPTMFNQILISPDTPRGAKKYNEHFLHGNYFSYLGLKSSTKPVYCTLNKTQPFYVPHFKKLSMYSEWRQQDHKSDKLYVSAYDSMQRSRKFTIAGKYDADYIAHSSYKFTASDVPITKEESQKCTSILGGYESNEDYTYIRGRGRGRYVCDQCGIRCKKPSMLKKHIRTHSNDRPYTCQHCNFSFKTKGNLTKHMKSKAHTKNYTASGSSSSSAQQSGTQSSDSDTEDSGMDSSDESSTRQQEHEAAYGLLSLSQKTASTMQGTDVASPSSATLSLSPISTISNTDSSVMTTASFINAEQLVHVSKTNYAKNKILDQKPGFSTSKLCNTVTTTVSTEDSRMSTYLGISSGSYKTLMYPYTTPNLEVCSDKEEIKAKEIEKPIERKNIIHFNVIKRYNSGQSNVIYRKNEGEEYKEKEAYTPVTPPEKLEDSFRKRKMPPESPVAYKIPKNDEVIDLSMPQVHEKTNNGVVVENERLKTYLDNIDERVKSKNLYNQLQSDESYRTQQQQRHVTYRSDGGPQENNRINVSYIIQESPVITDAANTSSKTIDYDNSAMETLADIATKQEKLEKNSVARNVATEFLKLATKNEYPNGEDKSFGNVGKDMNDLVGKAEENRSCTICLKNFNKPSQLRLHMNIHYLERPFRCESCSVSFRTKGHLQKHERSASHHNKLSSSPALSSSEPRPFKCSDCNVAFRIHGHLAKHLRSKMHIMKLECLAKIPFGLYAELERSNILLTEINTADGDQCLDSLKMLAKKVFINDPSKLNQLEERSDRIEQEGDS